MRTSKRDFLAAQLQNWGALWLLERAPRAASLTVVNYHRIGNTAGNPFDDGVYSATATEFERQVTHLRARFRILRLEELVELVDTGFHCTDHCALITFDDGYRDNFELAFPILRRLGVPATFFVPTACVEQPRLPWWDHVAFVIKQSKRSRIALDLPEPRVIDLDRSERTSVIRGLLKHCRRAAGFDPATFLAHLQERAEVDVDPVRLGKELFLSWDEVRQMLDSGMSVGCHTHTHSVLGPLSEEQQRAELRTSKRILEERLGCPIVSLAYPVGDATSFSEVTKRVAEDLGFRLAFSFYGGVNRPGRVDRFDLRRIGADAHDSFARFRARAVLNSAFGYSL